jgi:hypothetical protein
MTICQSTPLILKQLGSYSMFLTQIVMLDFQFQPLQIKLNATIQMPDPTVVGWSVASFFQSVNHFFGVNSTPRRFYLKFSLPLCVPCQDSHFDL